MIEWGDKVAAWVIVGLVGATALTVLFDQLIEPALGEPPTAAYPEPDAVYNAQSRTCMVYLVDGSELQYWQCSDGCEYIGTWRVKAPTDRLICPTTNEED